MPGQQPGTQTLLTSASLEPAELEHGARHASHNWVKDMWAQTMALHGGKDLTLQLNVLLQAPMSHSSSSHPHTAGRGGSRSQWGDSRALASAGQGLLEEAPQSKVSQAQPRPGCDRVSGSSQGLCTGPALRCQLWLLLPFQPAPLSRQGASAHPRRCSAPWPGHSGSGCGLSTAGSFRESSGPAPGQPGSTTGRWAQADPSPASSSLSSPSTALPGAAQGSRDTLELP